MTKKNLLTGLAAVLAVTTVGQQLQADQYGYNKSNWSNQYGNQNCCPTNQFWASADFLYWTTNDTDISSFDLDSVITVDAPLTLTDIGVDLHNRHKWDPGFRIGLGWVTACDQWDLGAVWTHLRSHRSRSSDLDFALPVVAPVVTSTITGTSSTSKWNYDTVDVELARDFQPACKLALRPFVSVRGAWLEHKSNLEIDEVDTVTGIVDPVVGLGSDTIINHKIYAVGPRIGLDSTWGNPIGFNLFGNISAGLLYGRHDDTFEIDTVDFDAVVGAAPTFLETDLTVRNRTWDLIPTLQVALGVAWAHQFDCGGLFRVSAGWESNVYWNVDRILRPDVAGITGLSFHNSERSLSLQGLTVSAGYDF